MSIQSIDAPGVRLQSHKDNNFDFIRHFAALLVLWSHSFSLSASPNDPLRALNIGGFLGVNIFFAISGYLITESWFRRNDVLAFVEARMRRIMPALIASVLICAFIIGPWLTKSPLSDYITDWHLRWFVAGNISMLWMGEYLPYLFVDNPHPLVVNGSLWTLPKEVIMYGLVLGVGLICRLRHLSGAFLPIFAVAYAYASWQFIDSEQSEDALSLLRMSRYFLAGAIVGNLTRTATGNALSALVLIATLVALPGHQEVQAVLLPIALTNCIFALARAPMPIVISGRWQMDLSYGLYIYSYPIQQTLFHFHPHIDGYAAFAYSLALTTLIATASWLLIEKPILAKRRMR